MCNLIYLSTTCPDDLSIIESPHFQFQPVSLELKDVLAKQLLYPCLWHMVDDTRACSCGFRCVPNIGPNRYAVPLFEEPQDWCPEDTDKVENTGAFHDWAMALLTSGEHLDLVSTWSNEWDAGEVHDVCLGKLPRADFRFHEGTTYRFTVFR